MKRRPVCLVCLILMFCIWLMDLAGFARISGNPLPESVQLYIEKHPEAVICGEVQQYQATEYSLSAYLKHVCLIVGSEQIPIKNLRVFLKSNKEFPIGTTVKISGKLEEIPEPRNPGEFDSRQFYACQKIYYFMKNGAVLAWSSKYSRYGQFMQNLKSKIMQTLDIAAKEDAGIFEAMLLGEKDNLEDEVKIRYQMAGIIHILAISGLHISVLGIGFFDLLKRAGFGNVSAGMVVLSVLLQYGILTGESVSAMRAVGMFLVAVGARIAGRTYDLLTALAVSAVLLLLDAPANLYNSGFWLSFGAVAGLGVVAPVLAGCIRVENRLAASVMKTLVSSIAVQMTTFPIMLRIYGEISLAGFFLNLLVLPTVSVVLVSGIAAVAVGMASVSAAVYVVLPGRVLLFLYEKLCELAAGIPFCTWIAGSPKLWQCAGYYVLLFLGVEILGMSRGTVTWNGATGKRAGNHAFMQEEKNHGEGKGWLRKYQLLSGISGIMLILGMLSGLFSESHVLTVLVNKLSKKLNTPGTILAGVWLSSLIICVIGGQYVAVTIPAVAFKDVCDEMDINRAVLSRTLGDVGVMIAALIPWNAWVIGYGVVLGGITVNEFIPYTFLPMLCPIISMIHNFAGVGLFHKDDEIKYRPLWRR